MDDSFNELSAREGGGGGATRPKLVVWNRSHSGSDRPVYIMIGPYTYSRRYIFAVMREVAQETLYITSSTGSHQANKHVYKMSDAIADSPSRKQT